MGSLQVYTQEMGWVLADVHTGNRWGPCRDTHRNCVGVLAGVHTGSEWGSLQGYTQEVCGGPCRGTHRVCLRGEGGGA